MANYIVRGVCFILRGVQKCEGHNCDFTYSEVNEKVPVLLLETHDGQKYELTLWTDEGECGSGWCTATFGMCNLKRVDEFSEMSHSPITPDEEIYFNSDEEIENKYFNYSSDGDDDYYPRGYVNVHMNEFEPISKMPMTKSANKV